MTIILCIATGIILGGLCAFSMSEDRSDVILNLMTGISGAVLGGWMLGPMLDAAPSTMNAFDESNIYAAIGGAIVLLVIVHVLQAQDRVE
ncbi:MAG: GlsB/YeaQ/YmgE family stress response membrane protein [Oxalicibacterium faecigallinarum]|uniref:GlsB/YeaQ/YmgE family stress response membrane protein n=1 Tax=Oxalicibacterium faecigallinarum TaxID=573741 RepID=A0A8J3F3R9_9BURK|nr:GlsB/YeaQ/YmgE family stress response membrane protein [Oxalicibacterium faecigallinarum]MDQ7968228.1 GlsB/YeaQ/YmgE family stress response membrane protein [Oxalicibacterium faecigallinarum]GGI20776.1 hypothetical protein GCM10008066_25720 [Oxalicibacterium faecigallinarum]